MLDFDSITSLDCFCCPVNLLRLLSMRVFIEEAAATEAAKKAKEEADKKAKQGELLVFKSSLCCVPS